MPTPTPTSKHRANKLGKEVSLVESDSDEEGWQVALSKVSSSFSKIFLRICSMHSRFICVLFQNLTFIMSGLVLYY